MAEPHPQSGLDRWTHPTAILVVINLSDPDLSDPDRLMPLAFDMAGETGARSQIFG